MAKPPLKIDTLTHDEASRKNAPTAEMEPLVDAETKRPIVAAYERRNPDLDPQLVWRGKDVADWSDLVVNAPPLYIQEKVHPKAIIEDLKRSSKRVADPEPMIDLFADFNGVEPDQRTEFYAHDQHWSNRMILGDGLQVMASLAEREGMKGQVQCIYIDPPYGIKFNSNFQWSTTSRDVKDGKADHFSREPEQVKAFRDTWADGIHSYLTYLRDRLTVARDLLTPSGSVFVQISDENIHRIRALLDEVFGDENFVAQIALLAGIGVGFLALVALEQINEGIRAPADVWDRLGLPLLGNVPLVEEEPLVALQDPKSYLSEAYFSIRSALAVATTHGLPRNLAVVSTLPSEGKSTTSLALAAVIGRTGKSVLLVDADLRSPSVHHLLGITNKAGFSNLLAGENDVAQYVQNSSYVGLHVLPSGPLPPSPSELLSSDRLGEVLQLLQARYDHIIFDAPPVLGLADAPLLGQAVEGLIYVIEPGLAPIRGIRSSIQRLRMLGGNIFGAVVTKIDSTRQHYGYSYGYGYGHGDGSYGYGKDVKDADLAA